MANILIIDNDRHTWNIFNREFSEDHLVKILTKVEDCVENRLKMCPDFIFVAVEFIDVLYDFLKLFSDTTLNITMHIQDFQKEGFVRLGKARERGLNFKVCLKPLTEGRIKEIINSGTFSHS
ncbi:MAG: hypothetical protein ACUZ8H_01260 [Candidatus Anammoxibacter sp.]